MKYAIIITALLAIYCLGICSLSEEASLVDSYIAKSQAEKPSWKTNDVFGGATPKEARKIWISELQNNTTLQSSAASQSNATLQSNATALNVTSSAANATATGATETESLVDAYIAKSLSEKGSWKSNDAFGFATPGESRKAASSNNQ